MNVRKSKMIAKQLATLSRGVAVLALICLATCAQPSFAQGNHHWRGEKYIGHYRREIRRRGGTDTIMMDVKPDHRVNVTTDHRNGTTSVGTGRWSAGGGLLTVTMRNGMQRSYRLNGPNLERADDRHIFFRKE